MRHTIRSAAPQLVLGRTVEGNKLVTLTGSDFARHKHIIGISGAGKSSFLAWCALVLLKQGIPFLVIDPHGDLAKLILALLATSDFFTHPQSMQRLWYVDFARSDAAIAWNVLKQEQEAHSIAASLLEAMHRAFPTATTSPSMDNMILASVFSLVKNDLPLTALSRFLVDEDYRGRLLTKIDDPLVAEFLRDKFAQNNSQLSDSTLRRSFLLTFSPTLRNILGQKENKLNFHTLMNVQQISCLFDLGGIDEQTKRLLGCLLMVGIEQAFLARATLPPEKRIPTHVIVDEFPLFSAAEDSFSIVLEQVRKYAGTLYLAHQTTSQLSKRITGALQNALPILFRVGYEDSSWAVQRFVRQREEPAPNDFDLFWHGSREPGLFDQVTPVQAKQRFETLARQEAIVTIGNHQVLHIRTPTLPAVRSDGGPLAAIECVYSQKLLTPLTAIERENTGVSPMVTPAAQLPLAKRRGTAGIAQEREPIQLLTGTLTPDLLLALYHFHYLTLSQIVKLLQRESTSNYIREKLKKLVAAGLVETMTLARSSLGKPPTVYTLTTAGLRHLADAQGVSLHQPTGVKKHGFLEHTLACSDMLIAAFLLPSLRPDLQLIALKHERTLKNAPVKVAEEVFVVPDGFVHLRAANESIGICFELDRNTEDREKIQQKIRNYVAFAKGPYQHTFGLDSLTIAFCVAEGGDRRVDQLITWAEQILKNAHDAAELFLFAQVSPDMTQPVPFFLDSFWHAPFDSTMHALVEPYSA